MGLGKAFLLDFSLFIDESVGGGLNWSCNCWNYSGCNYKQ
jgi:hypothetical protein